MSSEISEIKKFVKNSEIDFHRNRIEKHSNFNLQNENLRSMLWNKCGRNLFVAVMIAALQNMNASALNLIDEAVLFIDGATPPC